MNFSKSIDWFDFTNHFFHHYKSFCMSTVSDDLVWKILDKSFCSFKTEAKDQKICKHPMNIYQVCKMTFCPLANSQYATVTESKGKVFLCLKAVERIHLPSQMWEKIELDKNYQKALEQIDQYMQLWDKRQIKRCKIRYTKIQDYLKRMRKIRSSVQPKLETFKKKYERRLDKREKRALGVAQVENKIQEQLLERLRKGVYGDLYKFKQVEKEEEDEEEEEEVYIPKYDDIEVEYSDNDEEDLEDIFREYEDEDEPVKERKRRHINLEYEQE